MARNNGVKTLKKLRLRSFAGCEFPLPIIIISLLTLSYCARGGGTPVPENREAGVREASIATGSGNVDAGAGVAEAYCGNGILDQESEQCDINDLGTASCATLSDGGQAGVLSCNSDCTYNVVGCYDNTDPMSGIDTGTVGYGGL